MPKAPRYKWEFVPRFRARAFGWRSEPALQRLKEALAEIQKVSRTDPSLAAEGAVLLLEKLSPALEQVDSSSGAIGSAVNRAIDTLVPLIAQAPAGEETRDAWVDRLWAAYLADEVPYIEHLGDLWGELCASPERASRWADLLLLPLRQSWAQREGRRYFKGTHPCLACLLAAGRHLELLNLLEKAPFVWWPDRRYGVRALAAMGRLDEALAYAEASRGLNDNPAVIAATCEVLLLAAGRAEEAYDRYALAANQQSTYLATFRALAKKYPRKDKDAILADLIRSTPGEESKWFAAARSLKRHDLAARLAWQSPANPVTLIRGAQAEAAAQPAFALETALAAIHWITAGYGYEITNFDTFAAFDTAMQCADVLGKRAEVLARVRAILDADQPAADWTRKMLAVRLAAAGSG